MEAVKPPEHRPTSNEQAYNDLKQLRKERGKYWEYQNLREYQIELADRAELERKKNLRKKEWDRQADEMKDFNKEQEHSKADNKLQKAVDKINDNRPWWRKLFSRGKY